LDFGVFDHLDLGASSIERYYRERLELVGGLHPMRPPINQ